MGIRSLPIRLKYRCKSTLFLINTKKYFIFAHIFPEKGNLKPKIVIQRIQTIYLLVAILSTIGLYATGQDVEIAEIPFLAQGTTIASALLSVISIFSFKNRPKQIIFNHLNILINALLIGVLVYWILNLSGGIDFPEKGIEFFFPFINVVMFLLANANIRKDEKLVKSVDRLR